MSALTLATEAFEEFSPRSRPACPRCRHELHAETAHALGALEGLGSRRRAGPLESFDTYEHAELGTELQGGVQALVDAWARAGLIDGGAFIDTGAFPGFAGMRAAAKGIAEWAIAVPDAVPIGGSGSPYSGKALPAGARWHWIAPDPVFRRAGERWTTETLRAALLRGDAVALNVGQIVFLAGDLVPTFAALKSPNGVPYAPAPRGTMSGYHAFDPFAWELLSQLSPRPHLEEAWNRPRSLEQLRALEQPMNAWRAGKYETLRASLKSPKRPGWADSLKREVDLVQRLRGGRWYRELHVLAQTLWLPNTLSNGEILRQVPWLDEPSRKFLQATSERPFDDQFFQEVLTNGRYLALAFDNADHFAPGNWRRFASELRDALDAVHAHILSRTSPHPIPADAVGKLAFGLHFLTDAFSSGHMRVPRDKLLRDGNVLAKAMHDIDGTLGLTVTNGFQNTWRAFGDGRLRGPTSAVGKEVLRRQAKARQVNAAPDANLKAARAAVSAAVKQLHYHAQHHRRVANTEHVHRALDAARVAKDRLAGDERSPEGKPGPGNDVESWIRMSVKDRLDYLELHRPRPLPEGGNWDVRPLNHAPLVEPDGSINGRKLKKAGFSWAKDWSSLNSNRRIKVALPSTPLIEMDVLDATKLYQVVINTPPGATWAARDTKLAQLLRSLPEDVFD